jgi:uncharacterized membrane protein
VGRRPAVVALAVALAVVASSCTIALGDLGGPSSVANAINEAGVIVGSSELPGSTSSNVIERAFERLPDGTVVELASLPGTTRSRATAINDAGVIVGTATVGTAPDQQTHLVRWEVDRAVDDLGVIGTYPGSPAAIDAQGRIVSTRSTAGGNRAFVYDPAVGYPVDLPVIPGDMSTTAYGMNDEGDVVGHGWRPWPGGPQSSAGAPVRWDLDTWTVTDLEPLWGRGIAFDINDVGTIAGIWYHEGAGGGAQVDGVISRAGWPLTVIDETFLLSINDHDVVVGYDVAGAGAEAVRWEASTGTVQLEGDNSGAAGINDRGQIVGQHDRHAALFVPNLS